MWHYYNEEREIIINPFRKKSKFNPKQNDAVTEIYLSCLEKKFFSSTKNLVIRIWQRRKGNALYSLRDDTTIIIKEVNKCSGNVVWDRKGDLAKARTQLKVKIYTKSWRETLKVFLRRLLKVFYKKWEIEKT